jgi:hypothetical protein
MHGQNEAPGAEELLADGALGIADAMAFSGLGRTHLYQALGSGRLAYVIKGRRRLIPKRGLVAYLAEGLAGSKSGAA